MVYVRTGGETPENVMIYQGLVGVPVVVTARPAPGVVWNSSSYSGTSYQNEIYETSFGGAHAPLTQELFREGVEIIAAAVSAGGGSSSGGSGGGAADDLAASQAAALAGVTNPDSAAQLAAAQTASAALGTAINSGGVSIGSVTVEVDSASSVPSVFAVTLPARFGGKTYDFNPFRSDRLGPVISWFRTAVSWLTIVAFGGWLWSKFSEFLRAASTIRQAQGNAIAAGTGAQATSFVAAGVISAAVLTAAAALVGWSFDGLGLNQVLSTVNSSPLVAMPAACLWCVNMTLPVSVILTCYVGKITFERFATGIFAGLATVVRFCVP